MAKCLLLLSLLSVIAGLCLVVRADPEFILPSESRVRIQINWPGSALVQENEEQGNVLYLTSVDHERYKCFLPSSEDNDEKNASSDKYKGESPLQLLKPIFSQMVCALKIESFWIYELCHGYYITQFHEENSAKGKVRLEYFLGKYDLEAAFAEDRSKVENEPVNLPTVQVEDAQLPYFAINMTDGTFCEISGKKRFARVLYVCHQKGNNIIFSLKETSSCEYEIIVLTTVLCAHPAFRKKYFSETAVYCRPVDSSPTKPKRLEKMENSMKHELFKPFLGTAILEDEVETKAKSQALKEDTKILQERAKVIKAKVQDLTTTKVSRPTERDLKMAHDYENLHDEISKVLGISPHDDKIINDFLDGSYCLRGGSGWWRYEFCFGKHVNQYHINDDGSKLTVNLGKWDKENHIKWLKEHPVKKPKDIKYISRFYSNGEFCEETNSSRKVEVRLRCKEGSEGSGLDSVSMYLMEPKICEYILNVESPGFCFLVKGEYEEFGAEKN